MKRQTNTYSVVALILLSLGVLLIQGCGGGGDNEVSTVSGTVADINRNVIVDAIVSTDSQHETRSLISGTYRLNGVESGWRTVRAEATVDGELWVGSTAAEILENEPTFNVNIVLAPQTETTTISGTVRDTQGRPVSGSRVFMSTRFFDPDTDPELEDPAFNGAFGSIVAVTDDRGRYVMEDVPVRYVVGNESLPIDATIAASRVGFLNSEEDTRITDAPMSIDFTLSHSDLAFQQEAPQLVAIESYTMPDEITVRSSSNAYAAIKALTSERYRKAMSQRREVTTRATPDGSLIEVDLYWIGLDLNISTEVAGYGIYRTTTGIADDLQAIDFVRDPYAGFYGDTGIELTPGQEYTYAVNSVDVEFLDANNEPDPGARSELSNDLQVTPLGQLRVTAPADNANVGSTPVFTWQRLTGATNYTVLVYNRFPDLRLDPENETPSNATSGVGVLPIWISNPTTGTSATYAGPALIPGQRYYWVVRAFREFPADEFSSVAYSFGQLRSFAR